MKIKVSEASGHVLDWMVHATLHGSCKGYPEHSYSTDWAISGPIIEREWLTVSKQPVKGWGAFTRPDKPCKPQYGPTPLTAAMRCYVASKLGEEVEVPEGLQ